MTHEIRNLQHYRQGVTWLCRKDNTLSQVIDAWGEPPMWLRRPGFMALLHIILEQQVSLASAQAVMDKLRALVPRLTPGNFLALTDTQLKRAGFSQQKIRYSRALATAVATRTLRLSDLRNGNADDIRTELIKLPGIGQWTADIYILMALRRRDVWPIGDLALRLALRELFADELVSFGQHAQLQYPLTTTRGEDELQARFAERWSPWRGVAARICWLHYLRVRDR